MNRDDFVCCIKGGNMVGRVKRVSTKHSLADIDWGQWTKRMKFQHIKLLRTNIIDNSVVDFAFVGCKEHGMALTIDHLESIGFGVDHG